MGQGGFLTLVNGTLYDWNLTKVSSSQMNSWSNNFPKTLKSGATANVYIEWDEGLFTRVAQDSGDAVYTLAGTSYSFTIQARATNRFNLSVNFTSLSTTSNDQGTSLNLGWRHDGYVQFILAGQPGNFLSNNLPVGWMSSNLGTLGFRTLRQMCMPGSHDAGMSEVTGSTVFGFTCNTVTQRTDIHGQLMSGSRYFDIRPVISGGDYYTGHYSYITPDDAVAISAAAGAGKVVAGVSGAIVAAAATKLVTMVNDEGVNTWQGANGQSIAQIIDDINTFTANYPELIILNLSHDLNTDLGNQSYAPFTQDQWDGLFSLLSSINALYVVPSGTTDLTQLSLNAYIGSGKGAVVVVVNPSGKGVGVSPTYAGKGFYSGTMFPVYDSYSDTNDLSIMSSSTNSAGQIYKMKQQRGGGDPGYFLLSWTLTQSGWQSVACKLGASSVLDLSDVANAGLYQTLLPACSSTLYPNILYTDGSEGTNQAALAMAVNTITIPSMPAQPTLYQPILVTASSYVSPWIPSNVTNPAPVTYWMSAIDSGNPEWVELQFNTAITINYLTIVLNNGRQGTNPVVQGSSDGRTWTTLVSIDAFAFPNDEDNFRHIEIRSSTSWLYTYYRYYSDPSPYVLLNYFAVGRL